MTIFVTTTSTSTPFASIADYSSLQSAISSWAHRTGDTDFEAVIPDFITLAEATMQLKFKLLEFETTTNVTVTSGVGSVPSDFAGARSVYWSGSTVYEMQYIAPELFDARQNITDDVPTFYTVTGTSIKVSPSATGTAVVTYFGKFTPLSDTNTTNSILINSPSCYLYGGLFHAYTWAQDDAQMQKYGIMFNAAMDAVLNQDESRKYAGNLQVRAR